MNTKFVFDKKTGTMQPEQGANKVELKPMQSQSQQPVQRPQFNNEKTVNSTPQFGNYRVDDEKLALLEKYAKELGLEGILLFRQHADYTICQITDERSGNVMAYIGGYALNIKFNMEQLNSVAKVEQCLEGIKKLFRSFIVQQAIENK